MRVEQGGITVHVIPGSHSVLFGFDATEDVRKGLLGFALGRRNAASGTVNWMRGFKFFEETAPRPVPGERRSTREHPVQDFQWGDYSASPGQAIDYVIQAVYGSPSALTYGPEINLNVTPVGPGDGVHSVHFNRGAIPSQAFADKFGNVGPTQDEQNDPENEKVKWLSRGLLEAMLGFVGQAKGKRFELRVAAYEFTYPPILNALKAAAETGAAVHVVYDAGHRKRDGSIAPDDTTQPNADAIAAAGLDKTENLTLIPRHNFSKIPHNKFMVLLENGVPREILGGSTNFTPSGVLGQTNVVHIIRDPDIAGQYRRYWDKLSTDPDTRSFKAFNSATFPDPDGELGRDEMKAIFCPRKEGLLQWWAQRLGAATSSVMFTAAFGVALPLVEKFAEDKDFLRLILMERPNAKPEEQALLQTDRDTKIALGARLNKETIELQLDGHKLDEWFRQEEHFRKQGNIFYIHTKIMLLDILSEDPQIFSGSANFSAPSVSDNDENMFLLRGSGLRPAADIYVNEFMRIFNQLYFRTTAVRLAREKRGDPRKAAILEPTDAWVTSYFTEGSYHCRMRELFR
jgi:phosphatidylserine/phosphatidylglycerophosphate/cardiolipin synthase-like enzyme